MDSSLFHHVCNFLDSPLVRPLVTYGQPAWQLSLLILILLHVYYADSTETHYIFPEMLLPPATKLGQGYIFTGVCHSVKGGGMRQTPPLSRHPPRSRPPPGPDTPQTRSPWTRPPGADNPPPRDTVNARAVRILLECKLV